MALTDLSLFLYGIEVGDPNFALDFRVVSLETPRQANIPFGTYSLTALCEQIIASMKAVAPLETFTCTIDRTAEGGKGNRITIGTTGGFLELLWGTGPRQSVSIHPTIGFGSIDRTGATSYTSTASSGIVLVPDNIGYNFSDDSKNQEVFGSLNISASGTKEAIVYSIQSFFGVQFKYILEPKWNAEWKNLFIWLIQQRLFEFTPEISSPNVILEGTLEKTSASGKGLAFIGREMLPQFPFLYDTGLLKFRKRNIPPITI